MIEIGTMVASMASAAKQHEELRKLGLTPPAPPRPEKPVDEARHDETPLLMLAAFIFGVSL